MFSGDRLSSYLVVPPGPPVVAAFHSGMSAVEELQSLKAQVRDIARVCNVVAGGDLSQKITVPVQGAVLVRLKEVINQMVRPLRYLYNILYVTNSGALGGQARSIRKGSHSGLSGSRN